MNDKKTISVSILGKNYSLVTDEENSIVEGAAHMVDSLMKHVVNPATSPAEAAKKTTFVALRIAVDLLKKNAEYDVASERIASLNSLLQRHRLP
jgi:cell division protein ZapA (FtsZ GTPase activity inhibitor)